MNKVKFLFLIIGIFAYSQAMAMSQVTLCLTGKIELTLADYKVAFMNAVNLALSQNNAHENIKLKTYFYDNKPLSPIIAYNEMMHDHCAAIIGFEYLSDLLLVAKTQSNDTVPIFTSYASSNESDKLPPNIYIFEPSYNYQVKKMISFLRNRFGNISDVIVITEIDRSDLAKYKIAYEEQLNQEKLHFDNFDFIGSDDKFETKLKMFLIGKRYKYVFVLSGAVGSTKIINYMNDHNKVFIGTENFGSSTNQSLYVRLNDKNIAAFSIRNIDLLKRSKKLSAFITAYKDKYLIDPSPLSVYSYDAATIIVKAFERYHEINNKSILKNQYDGITGAFISNNKFHRSSDYTILSIGKNGFVYEE